MLTRTTRAGWVTPFETLFDVHRELDRVLDSGMNGREVWRPLATDIVETPEEVRAMVELPGMNAEDIDITIDDNVLKVSGESRATVERGEDTAFRIAERRYGRFERSFVLSRDVDANACEARYENGVLSVVLPKREEARPRRVRIGGTNAGRELRSGEVGEGSSSGN